jgi:proteic killer suppression protein
VPGSAQCIQQSTILTNSASRRSSDLAGKHSIRINDQWRIVFRWTDVGPEDVEIIDYH